MENASKALILAGEVLIGVLILGLIATVIATFGRFSSNMNAKIGQNKVLNFNNHFTKYDGRINITAQEIAGLLNFAKESNDSYELDAYGKTDDGKTSQYYVAVCIDEKNFFETNASSYSKTNELRDKITEFVAANNVNYYYCNVNINSIVKSTQGSKIKFTINRTDLGDIKINQENTGMVTRINFRTLNKNIRGEEFNVKTRGNYIIE